MLSYIRRLFQPKSKTYQRAQPRCSFKPSLELLERREVLSTFNLQAPVGVGTQPQLTAVGYLPSQVGAIRPFAAVTYEQHPDGGAGVSILRYTGDPANGLFTRTQDIEVVPGAEGIVTGHFSDPNTVDVAVASNGDANAPGSVTILRGDWNGNFTRVDRPDGNGGILPGTFDLPAGTVPTYLATATIRGLPYLFVADFSGHTAADPASNRILVYRGDGAGNFTEWGEYGSVSGPDQIVVGDFMGHGQLDLAVANKMGNSVTVFFGNGDGTFNFGQTIPLGAPDSQGNPGPANATPIGLATGYFDGDPRYLDGKNVHPDLAVVGEGGFVQILENQSTPGFVNFVLARNISVGYRLINVAVAGMGGNFQQDLAVTAPDLGAVLYLKNTSTAMDPATGNRGSFSFDIASIPADVIPGNGATPAQPIGLLSINLLRGGPRENDLIVTNQLPGTITVLSNTTRRAIPNLAGATFAFTDPLWAFDGGVPGRELGILTIWWEDPTSGAFGGFYAGAGAFGQVLVNGSISNMFLDSDGILTWNIFFVGINVLGDGRAFPLSFTGNLRGAGSAAPTLQDTMVGQLNGLGFYNLEGQDF